LLVRPSRKTFDAAFAAFGDVTFVVFLCDRALPAADFDALPVPPDVSVFDAFDAALPDVFFPAMAASSFSSDHRISSLASIQRNRRIPEAAAGHHGCCVDDVSALGCCSRGSFRACGGGHA
jgi:hypothetical protein